MIPQEVADIIDILDSWFGPNTDHHHAANEIYRKVIHPHKIRSY